MVSEVLSLLNHTLDYSWFIIRVAHLEPGITYSFSKFGSVAVQKGKVDF